tara:strand:+ start:195 stop:983 length:789 start_codon:yes stop_codon:yes gene_type:complete
MKRYIKTLSLFWNTAFAVQLEYQINFIIELIAMIGTLLGSIFILSLFFRGGNQLGNWSWESALVVQGIYTLLDGFTNFLLRPNLTEVVNYVREGTLDFVLLKPIDSQFWLSTRTLSPSGIPEIGLGIGLIIWAAEKNGSVFDVKLSLLGLLMLFTAIIILYSLWFLIASTSIWFVKTWNATEVLRAILSAGRFPISSYPLTLRTIFTLIIPITFLTTVPAQIILGLVQTKLIILGITIAIVFFLISRYFWQYAVSNYTSASS